MSETKKCSRCGVVKPVNEFYTNYRTVSLRPLAACKVCTSIQCKKFYVRNFERIKKRHEKYELENRSLRREMRLKKAYGIVQDEYDRILAKQGGRCATCQSHSRLMVDHCHSTGKVRGILCGMCNSALGYVKDSQKTLERMIAYLGVSR